MDFELRIKEFRLRFGLSQKRLSFKARLTQSYIAKLESSSRKKSPTLNTVYSISKALNVCPYSLIICNKDCNTCKLDKY